VGLFQRSVPGPRIVEILRAVIDLGGADPDKAWAQVKPLRKVQAHQYDAALALAELLEVGAFSIERGLELAPALFAAHADSAKLVGTLADAFENLHDLRDLNAEPPTDPLFVAIAGKLEALLGDSEGDARLAVLEGLTTAARVLGRGWDAVAERAHLELIELTPDRWQNHFHLGLFYKTRGRFAEGMAANQRAIELGSDLDGVVWNLGICATAVGEADIALEAWQSLGQKIKLGRFGLPDGGYRAAKVRLAEFPLAEREAGQGPGRSETIWIERVSPCHGIIRSALFADIGLDYGDVVMFDGAAITFHTYDKDRVPVFPHLATLSRQGYQIFELAGTQEREDQIAALSMELADEAVVYVHSETFGHLCDACFDDPDHEHADDPSKVRGVVTGKLCAPPGLAARALRDQLDKALESEPDVTLFVPELTLAAGDFERAERERSRLSTLGTLFGGTE
jgi:tetratricopeptide (TPR) repeat protein